MITFNEYIILNSMDEKFLNYYICRDSKGYIYLINKRPYKDNDIWVAGSRDVAFIDTFKNIFKCIKWSDEKARKVIDYIEEYEKKQWAEKKKESNKE